MPLGKIRHTYGLAPRLLTTDANKVLEGSDDHLHRRPPHGCVGGSLLPSMSSRCCPSSTTISSVLEDTRCSHGLHTYTEAASSKHGTSPSSCKFSRLRSNEGVLITNQRSYFGNPKELTLTYVSSVPCHLPCVTVRLLHGAHFQTRVFR